MGLEISINDMDLALSGLVREVHIVKDDAFIEAVIVFSQAVYVPDHQSFREEC